jgi:osmotically-inducible protein OsmY
MRAFLFSSTTNQGAGMKFNLAVCVAISAAIGSLSAYAEPAKEPTDPALDNAITNHVKEAFVDNPDVGTGIIVQTKNGIVYLKGKTTTTLARSHAEEVAKAVPGVQQVVADIGTEK